MRCVLKRWLWVSALGLILLSLPSGLALAQEVTPTEPVYIIQAGDTLSGIAELFNVSVDAIMAANGINNPNAIQAGQELVIPGIDWVSGIIISMPMPFGETLDSLSRRYQVSPAVLARLNRVVSPSELYVGYPLLLPVGDEAHSNRLPDRAVLAAGQRY